MNFNNSEVSIEVLNHQDSARYIYTLVFFVTVMLIGIVGNILVIVVYKTKLKRSYARVYIISLALADLSVCLVGIPYHVLDLTFTVNYPNAVACKLLSFLIGACTLSSIMILLVVGLDRFLKVCRPLKRQIIDFGDRKACLIAVVLATVLNIPNGIIYGESSVQLQNLNQTGVECFIADEYQDTSFAYGFLGFNIFLFIISVSFLIIIYGFIGRKIYHQAKRAEGFVLNETKRSCFCCTQRYVSKEDEDNNQSKVVFENKGELDDATVIDLEESKVGEENRDDNATVSAKANTKLTKNPPKTSSTMKKVSSATMIRHINTQGKPKENNARKITLMMMTITVVFILTYLPFIIVSLVDTLFENFWTSLSENGQIICDIFLRLYLINNFANPLIYGFWDKRFRTEVVLLIRSITCCATFVKSTNDSSLGSHATTHHMTTKRTTINN